MPASFLNDTAKSRLVATVQAIEARTAAELVIAVRPRAGSYLGTDLAAGIAAGTAVLAFLLWSPWPFATQWILLDPLLTGLTVALACSHSPSLRRRLTPTLRRRRRVAAAARATFVEKRVHVTQSRAGVLVHVSLTERMAEVVADVSVTSAVQEAAWRAACADVDLAVRTAKDGADLSPALERLGDLLASALPRQADDVNELPDEPCP